MAERYLIQGYEFSTKEEALEGKKELAAVKYLSEKVKEGSLKDALEIYEKIVKQNMFHTQIGIDYLKGLKTYLADNDVISDTTSEGFTRKIDRLTSQLAEEKSTNQKKFARMKELLYSSAIFNIVLIVVLIVFIIISSTSNNINILNYESKLQDKYAGWEQELQSKEAALKEIEQSLAALENNNSGR